LFVKKFGPFATREKISMKNKSVIIWTFMFFIMFVGCSTHQQLAGNEPGIMPEAPQVSASASSDVESDMASMSSSGSEDEMGYKIRPVEIEIEGGKPYLPVGAEVITQGGKVDLGDVIRALAGHKDFSVSWADDVDQQRPVDCYIKAADNFYDSLDNMLRQLDYFYEIEEDTIVVRYKETKRYHMAMPNFSESFETGLGGDMLPKGKDESGGLTATALLKINSEEFNFWDDLAEALTAIVNCDGCPAPIIDKTLGVITITASKRVHADIERHLAMVKREAYKQVIIEAKIIEVTLKEEWAKGIDWENVFSSADLQGKKLEGNIGLGDPTSGLLWGKDTGWDRLLDTVSIEDVPWDVAVSAFEIYGDTRIVANPKVHILNGHGAVLSAGQVIKYLESCEVSEGEFGGLQFEADIATLTEGLSIGIKANIINDEEVVLYVFPAITRLIDLKDIFKSECGQIQAPEMAVREMATYAKVRDREILVIGGLMQDAEDMVTKQVPVLADLPYLGKFFKYEVVDNVKRELVILLKPRIVSP
jgi:general secretion pathway protein D/MSHA biogenesis protein MshL